MSSWTYELLRIFTLATILAVVAPPAFGQEATEGRSSEVKAAAHKLASEILDTGGARRGPPFTSDSEHARSIDPVLTRGTPIWIHEALPSPPLTVLGGKVFSYNDVPHDPLDAPVLKIRPIDDDQVIPFLVRLLIIPDGDIGENAAVTVSFPAPPIFEPRIRHLRGWVGTKATEVDAERRLRGVARLHLRIPLNRQEILSAQAPRRTLSVIIAGELVLGPYRPVSANRYSDLGETSLEPSVAALANLVVDRDIDSPAEAQLIESIAETLRSGSHSAYEQVVAANSWVSDHLQYRQSPASRSAVEALEDRSGDCDEHTTLLLALLRAMGIPARRATGFLYNFDTLGNHAWVEVGLPRLDGAIHWFIVDPTLAGGRELEEEKAAYVQFKNRMFLYPMKPLVHLQGMTGRRKTDVLFNARRPRAERFASPAQVIEFVELVTTRVDREISAGAENLVDSGTLFRRESASIVGSPYAIVDRPLPGHSSNRVQLRLENEERLVVELSAGPESEVDDEAIDSLREVYRDLNKTFFAAKPAHHNLELVYSRDRHLDRLLAVRLTFGRYLVEHQLDRILKKLSKASILTEEETARISGTAEVSGGKNLYLLQELARRISTQDAASR